MRAESNLMAKNEGIGVWWEPRRTERWEWSYLLKNVVHFLYVTVSYYITHLELIQGKLR